MNQNKVVSKQHDGFLCEKCGRKSEKIIEMLDKKRRICPIRICYKCLKEELEITTKEK